MRNHDEKIKDMAESVLPSTRRRSARVDRRRAHKRCRTRQRDILAGFCGLADPDEHGADFFDKRRRQEVSDVVWARRGADKTGSLIRWAGVRIERDPRLSAAPVGEKVGHFARLLPDTLIGRHAVQHIESSLRSRDHPIYHRPRAAAQLRQVQRSRHVEQVAADLGAALAAGRHGRLNAALRAGYRRRMTVGPDGAERLPPPNRLFLGSHDIDGFAVAVADHAWIRELVHAFAVS
ncbi:hypothetical protein Ga0074812_102425 [Parafrankia irregularis]|uniref:Uncharacterized protein n=1 Tax=Parafrankia irregularis TaxID=795642 RepID=A0A0S4QGU6_9ACTN|nr:MULTISPECIES: hypothetical protein [Parafrankia]MBE3202956.1 hypothetical protein [Parafrankia sp. CH37]CUU54415.1 hypothetical protein Ga0074812_102425 [Parafrankia irregularis]